MPERLRKIERREIARDRLAVSGLADVRDVQRVRLRPLHGRRQLDPAGGNSVLGLGVVGLGDDERVAAVVFLPQ